MNQPPGNRLRYLAVILVALTLRGPMVAVSAVVGSIRGDLGISAQTVGLLSSLPVLCFGLASPLAALLIARAGMRRAIVIALAGIFAGVLVRSSGGLAVALVGTVIIGLSITIGNVAMPVVMGKNFPKSTGTATGVYVSALNVGSMAAVSLTAPIAAIAGWRIALLAGSPILLAAVVVWLRSESRQGLRPREVVQISTAAHGSNGVEPGSSLRSTLRRPIAWVLTIAFAGQTFGYYGLTAWLPSLLGDERHMAAGSAGYAASIFQIMAIVGALLVPILVKRWSLPRLPFLLMAILWLSAPTGLLFVPALWPLWCVLGGIAQGGTITALFMMVVQQSRTVGESRRLSALVQSGGYMLGAFAPSLVGAVHTTSNGWTTPLLVVFAALSVTAVSGLIAAAAPVPAGRT